MQAGSDPIDVVLVTTCRPTPASSRPAGGGLWRCFGEVRLVTKLIATWLATQGVAFGGQPA